MKLKKLNKIPAGTTEIPIEIINVMILQTLSRS